MLRFLLSSIWTTANALRNQNATVTDNNQATTSKWRTIGKFLLSVLTTLGIPFVQSLTENETVYDCVNTLLANSPTTRSANARQQRSNSSLSRFSRTNFRRRSNHENRVVRIIKPTIHIHIHH